MKRRGLWAGRGLAVLGLAAVVGAVLHATTWAFVAAAGGFLAATGLALAPLARAWVSGGPPARPIDFAHALDLLRQAHGARAGWAVGQGDQDVEVAGREALDRGARQRGVAIVHLASIDGRAHVARESEGTYVAVGDFPFGAGLLLAQRDAAPEQAEAAAEELRRLLAGMRLTELVAAEPQGQLVARQLAAIAGGARTLEGIAKAGVELAQQLCQRGAAVVIRWGGEDERVQVLAVSTAADGRLAGVTLSASAPAARAISTGVPVVTLASEDIFGPGVPDRRRQERAGTALPLVDGHFTVGALILLGPPMDAEAPSAEQVKQLVAELAPRLAAARAVHEAEQRAILDPLTGLCNRREFERRLARHQRIKQPSPATLIYADLDRFKALNDTLGHAAGDAALRHVAGILQAAIRDGDLAARIGGEEFAVWLPTTPFPAGLEVAERIRHTVATTAWRWNGAPYALTVSCGVAGFPDSVGDSTNLRSAADAALYRAKQAGRNRVEQAAG